MRTIIRNNYDPHIGDYHERIIQDEAREKTWLFDCDGVYLDITAGRGDTKVVNELGDSEVDATSQKLVTDELGKKQDTLVAGDNITIEGNVISAGGGSYTAGYGLTLTGTEFAANTSVLATQTDLAGKQNALTTGQLAAVNSGIDSTKVGQIATNTTSITTINGKIPAQATSSNQLADKDFVNSSIATNTANFIGTFNSVAELEAYSGAVTNNDYAFVIVTDAQGNTAYDRYKYNGNTSTWLFEYELNNSSFTADQWASINSGITSGDVSKLAGIAAGAEVNVQSNWNESDTSSDAYIQNKPTIPTVNDATLTITQNGTSVGTCTANASTDVTIALTDTTYSAFVGTDGTAAGTAGLVPAPATTDAGKFLKADGTWDTAGSSVNVVQTTGTSTTDVMSQNATSRMVYKNEATTSSGNAIFVSKANGTPADGSLTIGVAARVPSEAMVTIGNSANSNYPGGTQSVALGNASEATGDYSVAAGYQSKATAKGEFNIGLWAAGNGYNNSAYRLLSGLYDGQSAHDAATKGQLDAVVLTNAGAPTTSTVGTIGQLLEDTTNAKLYQLTAIDTTDPQNPSYTWSEVGGSSGPTVVQTTGTSTTDVMSQNAVTSMVFADPSVRKRVQIGDSNTSAYNANGGVAIGARAFAYGEGSIAIGSAGHVSLRAYAEGHGSIAIGREAKTSSQNSIALLGEVKSGSNGSIAIGTGSVVPNNVPGQFDISATTAGNSFGYKSSIYRLLTGLYNPQSAHDAATKGYVDNAVINGGTTAPTSATVGAVGTQYTYVDTTGTPTAHLCVCTEIDNTDPSNPVYTWQTLI